MAELHKQWLLNHISGDRNPNYWPPLTWMVEPHCGYHPVMVVADAIFGTFYAGVPLYGTHIELKNRFWTFALQHFAQIPFRVRKGLSGCVVGLGRLFWGRSKIPTFVGRYLPPYLACP